MSLSERTKWAIGLLAKISVITGWSVPENEALNILADQFEKKLFESFQNVNPDEVEYAFRNRSNEVKDWGKNLNLSLVDDVMIPYLEKRKIISQIEEQQKVKQIEATVKEDLSEKAMMEWWKDVEKRVCVSHYRMEFMPVPLYEWMDKQGGINKTAKEKKGYIQRAISFRLSQLADAYEREGTQAAKNELWKFRDMKNAGVLEGLEVKKIRDIAKRIIIHEMMSSENNA